MFAYEQCLLVLGHHPDIWYEAAQYLEQSSKLLAEKGVCDPLKSLTCHTSFEFQVDTGNENSVLSWHTLTNKVLTTIKNVGC